MNIETYAKRHRCIIPTRNSTKHKILKHLAEGHSITMLEGFMAFRTVCTTQRVNELARDGWPIKKRWIRAMNGQRVREYRL